MGCRGLGLNLLVLKASMNLGSSKVAVYAFPTFLNRGNLQQTSKYLSSLWGPSKCTTNFLDMRELFVPGANHPNCLLGGPWVIITHS